MMKSAGQLVVIKLKKCVNKFESIDDLELKVTDIYNSRWCIKCSTTLRRWCREFNHHNNQHFINPYTTGAKKTLPVFIENNPDIKEAITAYCTHLGDKWQSGICHMICHTKLALLAIYHKMNYIQQ